MSQNLQRSTGAQHRGRELRLRTYAHFASDDLLCERTVETMLAGLSTRRHRAALEPTGTDDRSVSKSAVSRRFVARTRRCLAELMARPVPGRSGGAGRQAMSRLANHDDGALPQIADPLLAPPKPEAANSPPAAQRAGCVCLCTRSRADRYFDYDVGCCRCTGTFSLSGGRCGRCARISGQSVSRSVSARRGGAPSIFDAD